MLRRSKSLLVAVAVAAQAVVAPVAMAEEVNPDLFINYKSERLCGIAGSEVKIVIDDAVTMNITGASGCVPLAAFDDKSYNAEVYSGLDDASGEYKYHNTITVPQRPAAPEGLYTLKDGYSSYISGLDQNKAYEYKNSYYDDSYSYSSVDAGVSRFSVLAISKGYKVRYAATSGSFASSDVVIPFDNQQLDLTVDTVSWPDLNSPADAVEKTVKITNNNGVDVVLKDFQSDAFKANYTPGMVIKPGKTIEVPVQPIYEKVSTWGGTYGFKFLAVAGTQGQFLSQEVQLKRTGETDSEREDREKAEAESKRTDILVKTIYGAGILAVLGAIGYTIYHFAVVRPDLERRCMQNEMYACFKLANFF